MAKGKMKMLHLIRIFTEDTDDEHALTLQDIVVKLSSVDITADRKTLYADFEDLRHYGWCQRLTRMGSASASAVIRSPKSYPFRTSIESPKSGPGRDQKNKAERLKTENRTKEFQS